MKILVLLFCVSGLLYACSSVDENPMRGVKITAISPETASALDTVVITGENFKAINTNVVLFPENKAARVLTTSTTKLVVIVPSKGVVDGPVKVVVSSYETAVSDQIFKIK